MRFPWFVSKNLFSGIVYEGEEFPCECDEGWMPLIYEFLQKLEDLYRENGADVNELIFYQIKEKYGGLVIYLGNYIDGVSDLVTEYEYKSLHICEICGESGKLSARGGWYKTLCEKHRDENGYKEAIFDA
jgi:hypothetical protein